MSVIQHRLFLLLMWWHLFVFMNVSTLSKKIRIVWNEASLLLIVLARKVMLSAPSVCLLLILTKLPLTFIFCIFPQLTWVWRSWSRSVWFVWPRVTAILVVVETLTLGSVPVVLKYLMLLKFQSCPEIVLKSEVVLKF